jgi:hypothetical protein
MNPRHNLFLHLSPRAGRGRAQRVAPKARPMAGSGAGEGGSQRVRLSPPLRMLPLTPTLSPQAGGGSAAFVGQPT